MANRYWVGGAGTWNTTSTTNWSASSGGGSGASVPTSADSVFFDQAGTYTVTMTGGLNCLDITVSAGTVTFAQGTSPTLNIAGSMTLLAGTVWSTAASITFSATSGARTITTNGVTINAANFQIGPTGIANTATFTLGSALTVASTLGVASGTFDTSSIGNYAVTCVQFSSNNATTRTINLNGSTINASFNAQSALNFGTITGLTFNAGTSQINLSSTTSGISSGGLTFYNVSFTSVVGASISITGSNTFNTLSFASRTGTMGITPVTFNANQTIGTLTLNAGTTAAFRTFLASDTIGTQRTLAVTTLTAGAADYDFRDIAITGSAAPLTGTRFGDCKGNSGITFDAAKTVYYRQGGSASWGVSGSGSWSFTSGGSLNATAFPLAQDTAIFPAATFPVSGSTTTINANYNIGTIDMSLRTTNTMTLATGVTTPTIYGNWINGTGTTLTGTGRITFAGRGAQTIRSEGKTFGQPFTIDTPGGSIALIDAFTNSPSTTLTQGTLDLQSYSWTTTAFLSTNSNTRSIAFNTGSISCTGTGTVWQISTSVGFTSSGSQQVYVTSSGSTAITVFPGFQLSEANSISFTFTSGTYPLTFLAINNHVCKNAIFTGYAGTWASTGAVKVFGDLSLSSGMTVSSSSSIFTFASTSSTPRTITTSGKTLNFPIVFDGVGGTWKLQDDLSIGGNTLTLTNGTFDANGKNTTVNLFASSSANIRTLALGSGTFTVSGSGSTAFNMNTSTNATVTGTGTISLTSASAKTFSGGGIQTYPTLNQGGTGALTISGSNKFANITNTAIGSVLFTSGTTNEFSAFNLNGASGNLLTLGATTTSQATLKKPTTWYMGANSTDAGNNTGLTFTAGGGIDYLNVSYINGQTTLVYNGNSNFMVFFS